MVTRAAPVVMWRYSVWVACQWSWVVREEKRWKVIVVGARGVGVGELGCEEDSVGGGLKAKVQASGRGRVKAVRWVVVVKGIGASWRVES